MEMTSEEQLTGFTIRKISVLHKKVHTLMAYIGGGQDFNSVDCSCILVH